jgi:hypothetical protein
MARLLGLWLAAVLLVSVVAYGADVTLNGYFQYQYVAKEKIGPTDPSTNFGIKAARLKGSMKVTDQISASVTIDGAKSISVLDANIEYAYAPFLTLRLGQFQVPFGYETQNSNFDVEAVDRSQIVSALWNNGTTAGYLRDQGLMVYGRHKVLVYQLACVNGSGVNTSDNNNHKDLVGRVGIGIPAFAGLGVSVLQGQGGLQDDLLDRTGFGCDLFLDTGKLLVEGEYISAKGCNAWIGSGWTGSETEYAGYYAILGYRITPLIQPTFKYDTYDPDKDTDDDEVTAMYFGLNLNFEGKARLQTFYVTVDEDPSVDNNKLVVQAQAKF